MDICQCTETNLPKSQFSLAYQLLGKLTFGELACFWKSWSMYKKGKEMNETIFISLILGVEHCALCFVYIILFHLSSEALWNILIILIFQNRKTEHHRI